MYNQSQVKTSFEFGSRVVADGGNGDSLSQLRVIDIPAIDPLLLKIIVILALYSLSIYGWHDSGCRLINSS